MEISKLLFFVQHKLKSLILHCHCIDVLIFTEVVLLTFDNDDDFTNYC